MCEGRNVNQEISIHYNLYDKWKAYKAKQCIAQSISSHYFWDSPRDYFQKRTSLILSRSVVITVFRGGGLSSYLFGGIIATFFSC